MIFNMNIIFLDIDGVLRTHESDLAWSKELNEPVRRGTNRLFSKKAVDNLNEVIFLTKAKIVVTSSWRLKLSLEQLKKVFKERGVEGEVIAKTSSDYIDNDYFIPIGNRGLEIRQWLQDNHYSKFVVIDDQVKDIVSIIPDYKVVKVNPLVGFVEVDKVLDILL